MSRNKLGPKQASRLADDAILARAHFQLITPNAALAPLTLSHWSLSAGRVLEERLASPLPLPLSIARNRANRLSLVTLARSS